MRRVTRFYRRVGPGVMVVVLATISIGLSTDLRSPPRYDGSGYSILALSIQTGRGYHEIHQPANRPHSHFPPGYPLALAGVWSVTGRSDLAAHLFSIVCSVTAVGVAWLWLQRVERKRIANVLAVALAINWTWAMNGGAIQSEPLYLLLSVLVLWRAQRRGGLILGLLLGACIVTRHVGICLLLAVLIDRVIDKRWREVIWIGVVSTFVVVPWVFWLARVQQETQVGLLQSQGFVSLVLGQVVFYARRIPDVLTGPFVEVATIFGQSRLMAWVATLGASVISLLILYGLVRAVLNPRKRLAGLVPLVTLPLLLVWPFTEAGRFLVPLVPCLLVGLVEGFNWVIKQLSRFIPVLMRVHGRSRLIAAGLVLLIALPYPAYALITSRARAQRQTHHEFDVSCAWIRTEATQPGPILSRHPAEVYWQTNRLAVAPMSDDMNDLMDQIDNQLIAYLLVDPDRFAKAPTTPMTKLIETRPERFHRVRTGLVEVYEVRRDSGF